jgi:hypothetical protein
MHLLLNSSACIGRSFVGHIFEYKWKTRQKAQLGKRKAEMRRGIKGESPPTHQT